MQFNRILASLFMLLIAPFMAMAEPKADDFIWIEGENPTVNRMNRHPWWYDKVKKDQLSGGDYISNFNKDKPGEAEYRFTARSAGEYEFWVRANPVKARLSYALNGGGNIPIDLSSGGSGATNLADDGKPDLRFVAWQDLCKNFVNTNQIANACSRRLVIS